MKNKIDYLAQEKTHELSFFSEYEIFDWYDGAISGIGQLSGTNEFYWFNMVAWNLEINEKIFVILKIDLEWQNSFKTKLIKTKPNSIKKFILNFYSDYEYEVYLLKAKYIEDKTYDLKEIKVNSLIYYQNIDAIEKQTKRSKNAWFDFFHPL